MIPWRGAGGPPVRPGDCLTLIGPVGSTRPVWPVESVGWLYGAWGARIDCEGDLVWCVLRPTIHRVLPRSRR